MYGMGELQVRFTQHFEFLRARLTSGERARRAFGKGTVGKNGEGKGLSALRSEASAGACGGGKLWGNMERRQADRRSYVGRWILTTRRPAVEHGVQPYIGRRGGCTPAQSIMTSSSSFVGAIGWFRSVDDGRGLLDRKRVFHPPSSGSAAIGAVPNEARVGTRSLEHAGARTPGGSACWTELARPKELRRAGEWEGRPTKLFFGEAKA